MTDTTSPPDDFDSSARRFAEAADALEELLDNAGTLADLKTQQVDASQALSLNPPIGLW